MKRLFVSVLVAAVVLVLPRLASAYPWMIRDGYTACATCHADPSGAGLLTAYGRAQSQAILSMFPGPADEAATTSQALFGLLPEPESLLYSVAWRSASFLTKTSQQKASHRYIVMQADLRGQLTLAERLRINASVGFVPSGGQLAAIIPDNALQLVSREHWVGVDLFEERDVLLRAGRIAVPYGIRGNEHPMWSRSLLRTDIASHQQHGVAIARTAASYRTEIMALLGNYQVAPDLYRERGYAGYFEKVLGEGVALGLSSQLTHAGGDLFRSRREPITRHSHGLFTRWVLAPPLVLLAQADLAVRHPSGQDTEIGYVGFAQGDLELVRGVHLLPALELQARRADRGGADFGGWLSAAWFPYSHVETRLDLVNRSIDTPGGRVGNMSLLVQIHLYL